MANPAMNQDIIANNMAMDRTAGTMTVNGAIFKTLALLVLLLIPAVYSWMQVINGTFNPILLWVGIGGGLLFAIVTIVKKNWSPITAPLYALCEGLFLGGISAMFEVEMQGIVLQAIALTLFVLVAMLTLYRFGIIRPTKKFMAIVMGATGAIALVYLATLVLGFFGISIPYIHGYGPIGIIFSVVVCIVAALNLIIDFAFFEKGEEMAAPKWMEWYAAFGLLVTLVWLYLEILRLLAKLKRR